MASVTVVFSRDPAAEVTNNLVVSIPAQDEALLFVPGPIGFMPVLVTAKSQKSLKILAEIQTVV